MRPNDNPAPRESRLKELQTEVTEALRIADQVTEAKAQLIGLQTELDAKETRLTGLTERVKTAQSDYDRKVSEHTANLKLLQTEASRLKQAIGNAVKQKERLDKESQAVGSELEQIGGDIQSARSSYISQTNQNNATLREQEKLMQSFKVTISQTEQRISHLLEDLNRQAHTKELNDQELQVAQERLSTLTNDHRREVERHQLDLGAMEVETANKRTLLASFDAQMQKRTQEVTTREQSLTIREAALMHQGKELDAQRRKFESDKALYGV